MARRLDKTLADYVGIAISPVLIMLLVGSLMYFLLEVFYQGHYSGRLHWVMFWFTIAVVLIGRIAIEEGKERALVFAACLALAVFLALARFGEASFAALFLIALVWWSAHKLTWDCTFIDETEDASGEGLLQTAGLDKQATAGTTPQVDEVEEPEGVTSRDVEPQNWWERFLERRRRPHAPGVWIVYFSLAALPIFGIGQLFIKSDDVDRRRYVFLLLLVYVASGLGLLLTTSFLGLRRYLRQRRIQMPAAMAGLWITIGCVLILALLAVAALLPRPNAEYDIAELPFRMGSSPRESSRHAVMGGEAAEEDQGGPRIGQREEDQGEQEEAEDDGRQSRAGPNAKEGGSAAQQGKDDSQSKAASQDGQGSKSGGKTKGKTSSSGSGSKKGESRAGSEEDDKDSKAGSKQQDRGSRSDRPKEQRGKGSKSPRQQQGRAGGQDREAEADEPSGSESDQDQDDDARAGSPQQRSFSPTEALRKLGGGLGTLLKWIIWIVLLGVIGYLVWRNRAELLKGLQDFLNGWREFWQRLFGRKEKESGTTAAAEGGPKPEQARPFSDFSDPFSTGTADSYSPNELVRYTFEAFEAWAREHGCPREPDQTPHEFAQQVGARVTSLSQDAQRLADLYCRVAYDAGRVSRKSVAPLERFWRGLREREWMPV